MMHPTKHFKFPVAVGRAWARTLSLTTATATTSAAPMLRLSAQM